VNVIGKLFDWDKTSFNCSPLATKLKIIGIITRKMFPALLWLFVELVSVPIFQPCHVGNPNSFCPGRDQHSERGHDYQGPEDEKCFAEHTVESFVSIPDSQK
jgi:hypothetical protein